MQALAVPDAAKEFDSIHTYLYKLQYSAAERATGKNAPKGKCVHCRAINSFRGVKGDFACMMCNSHNLYPLHNMHVFKLFSVHIMRTVSDSARAASGNEVNRLSGSQSHRAQQALWQQRLGDGATWRQVLLTQASNAYMWIYNCPTCGELMDYDNEGKEFCRNQCKHSTLAVQSVNKIRFVLPILYLMLFTFCLSFAIVWGFT